MAGSSNFQQFNPNATNQLTDAEYTSDATRSSGAANPSVFPSETANKLFYQLSTFIYAMAQMLANKGYVLSDANAATLSAVLANMMTAADMAPYAPKASPALSGTPTTPTPAQSSADQTIPNTFWTSTYFAAINWVTANFAPLTSPPLTGTPTAPTPPGTDSGNRLATTAFVKGLNYQPNLGFTPVQQGGGAGQGANKVYLGWDGTAGAPRIQVDALDLGTVAMKSQFGASLSGIGYQRLPSGLLIQWGYVGGGSLTPGTAVAVSFPVAFQSAPWSIALAPDCTLNGQTTAWFSAVGRSSTGFSMYQAPGTDFGSKGNHTWIAIGQ